MSHTVYFGKVSKRKNSTLQPSLSASFDVLFKTPTSLDKPTFTINADSFDYNYAKMGDRYYFVTDIVSRNNDLWEVSCELDPLATFKSEILASTQFVSYSSVQSSVYLSDDRIPLLDNSTSTATQTSVTPVSSTGCYILSVVGTNGVASYRLGGIASLVLLISNLQTWVDDFQDAATNLITTTTDTAEAVSNIGKALTQTGFVGNAYENAMAGIRGCIWVPFSPATIGGTSRNIYIGKYDTGTTGYYITNENITGSFSVTIPWTYSDWRRSKCEDVYLFLPLVGNIQLSSDSINHVSAITVSYSIAPVSGDISYRVNAGTEVIGTYGANVGAQVPIGINQSTSLGGIVSSAFSGVEKTVSSAIKGFSVAGPLGALGGAIGGAAVGTYDVANKTLSTNMTTVGGIGGSAGAGVGTSCICSVVVHAPVINPAQMVATMGYPTMKPLTLSSCSGYCQCANAHVSAAAESQYLNMIDAYLNGGFYIE